MKKLIVKVVILATVFNGVGTFAAEPSSANLLPQVVLVRSALE